MSWMLMKKLRNCLKRRATKKGKWLLMIESISLIELFVLTDWEKLFFILALQIEIKAFGVNTLMFCLISFR